MSLTVRRPNRPPYRISKLAGRQTVHETPQFKHAPKPLAAAGVQQHHGNCTTAKPNSSTHGCAARASSTRCAHTTAHRQAVPRMEDSNSSIQPPGTQPQPHTQHKIQVPACSRPLLRSDCCGGSSCTGQQRTQRRSRKPSRGLHGISGQPQRTLLRPTPSQGWLTCVDSSCQRGTQALPA